MLLLPKSTAFHNSIFSGCRDSYPKPVVVVFGVTKKMSNRKGVAEMPQVKVIQPIAEQAKKLRVAAYARVSSDSADQLNSFATQVDYYTSYIQSQEEWEFAGLYADEAVSGTTADKRNDFQRLLADCRAGKIDRILVKSISRFARNTIDCIQTVRELGQLGISVEFEKEGIDTGNMGSEMLLSILGSAAQEESLSISKNLKWSYRRRMKSGDFITCNAPLGYYLKNGTLIPDSQEVPIVEYIFSSYLAGKSMEEISDDLNAQETQFIRKKKARWYRTSIRYVLSNEKYIGDSLLQKTYTPTEFPLVNVRNNGQLSKFYIKNSHWGYGRIRFAIAQNQNIYRVFFFTENSVSRNFFHTEFRHVVFRHKNKGQRYKEGCKSQNEHKKAKDSFHINHDSTSLKACVDGFNRDISFPIGPENDNK